MKTSPLIGIPASADPTRSRAAYVQALERAGGAPLLIPLLEDPRALEAVLERLDGLLLPGGPDVDPQHYREAALPNVNEVVAQADRVELLLARAAAAAATPLLGICRGSQVLNVALGGSLYQDLRSQRATTLDHAGSRPIARSHLLHAVRIEPGSRLAAVLGSTGLMVNSLHHQGIKTVAPSLEPVAWSPDGVIEGVEGTRGFCLAVQWHPEELPAQPAAVRLFEAFVAACSSASHVVMDGSRHARQA